MANLNLLRRSYLRNCDHLSLERTWQYWFTIVNTFAKVGITAAASVINFVVLTAALSGANSGIYSSSRMLYKLAHEGEAPKHLSTCQRELFQVTQLSVLRQEFSWALC